MAKQVRPSWGLGLKLWWAWFWRYFLIVIVFSILAGIVLGVIGGIIGMAETTIATLGFLLGLVISFYFMPAIFKRLMTKGFGKYRLVVVTKD